MPRARVRGGTITVEADVDVCDVLNDLSTRDLEDELASRKDRSLGGVADTAAIERDLIVLAHEELLRGRAAAALALLDRALLPSQIAKPADKRLMHFDAARVQ